VVVQEGQHGEDLAVVVGGFGDARSFMRMLRFVVPGPPCRHGDQLSGMAAIPTLAPGDPEHSMSRSARLSLTLTAGAPSAERVAEVLDVPARASGSTPAHLEPSVRLEGVWLEYDCGPVLADLELDVPAGTRLALRGPNGAGRRSAGWCLRRAGGAPRAGRRLPAHHQRADPAVRTVSTTGSGWAPGGRQAAVGSTPR
jgi:hypothetical protein